ncbi:unnamed protein product [Didymodactylos carnosus]|nr:unnamed protein product [Didymodactylos carnosus]CAF4266048.1 unnamed protein product [Didymodactylos carnosus]
MIVIKGLDFDRKKSAKLAKYVIVGVVLFSILLSWHEILYHYLVDDPSQAPGHYWCVAEYKEKWIEVYEQTTNIINMIAPFLINLVTTIILLITVVRRKVTSLTNDKNKDAFQLLKEHLSLYKAFIISPFLIIVLELPRLVLLFSLACIQFEWQKHLYLSSYLISQLPFVLTLLIFVVTKRSYRQELMKLSMKIQTRFTSIDATRM